MRHQILAAAAVTALAAAAAPALAQVTTVEQVTVMGRYMHHGEPPVQLSRVVDYSDLDLRLAADQATLRHRVIRAADDVCNQLGRSSPTHTQLGQSCRDQAVRDAMHQVGYAVAQAYARPAPAYAYVVPAPPPPAAYPAPSADSYSAPASATVPQAPEADTYGQSASYTSETITNGPVPDTAANRARYGGPMSNAGRDTKPIGN